MNNYPIVKLQDYADIKGGKRTPKGASVQEEQTDHPYIRVKDFDGHDLNSNGIGYITEEVHKRIQRYTISKDDIFISIAGTIGVIGKIPESLDGANLTENAAKITNISTEFDKDYLLYFLRSKYGQQIIKGRTTGTSQPKLALFRIREFEIPKPPKETQRKIASILSAFDDLIENNTRRIEILEEMARRIYREWFVHFHYPGHEDDELVDSSTVLGEIPDGWEVKKLENIIELNYGKGLRKKDRVEGKYPVYGSSGIIDWHNDYQVEGPGVIVGRKGNVGSMFWEYENFNPIDTSFYVETPLPLTYAYYNLQNQNFINSDAAVPGLSKRQASTLPVLVPDEKILKSFDTKILQLFELKRVLNEKNEKLKETRDLLLPKLISGEIQVHE